MNKYFIPIFLLLPCVSFASNDCETDNFCLTQPTIVYENETCNGKIHKLNISGELLWWKTHVKGTPFVFTHQTLFTFFETNSQLLHVHFHHKPGFRLNFLYQWQCDWDAGVIFTRFRQKGKRTVNATNETSLRTVWDQFGFIAPTSASAVAHQKFQTIDAIVGKTFFWDCPFSLRYYFGLKGASLQERINIIYSGTPLQDGVLSPLKVNLFNDYNAVGIINGIDAHYNLPCNFSLYGRTEFALVAGKLLIVQEELVNFRPSADVITLVPVDTTNRVSTVRLNVAFQTGFQWNTSVWCNRIDIGLKIGYELNYWPNQLFFSKFLGQQGQEFILQQPGDVSFSGLVFGGHIAF